MITIPNISQSLNEILNKAKTHWSAYHRIQKSIVSGLTLYLKSKKIEPVIKYPVSVTMRWYEENKRTDPDNCASSKKFIMDSLVKANILRNDNFVSISEFHDYFYIDKTNPRIEIEIKEVRK